MVYFKKTKEEFIHNIRHVAFDVGKNKNTYSIVSNYWHHIEDDIVSHQHEVVKNWISVDKKEVLFRGSLKECYKFIEDIVSPKY